MSCEEGFPVIWAYIIGCASLLACVIANSDKTAPAGDTARPRLPRRENVAIENHSTRAPEPEDNRQGTDGYGVSSDSGISASVLSPEALVPPEPNDLEAPVDSEQVGIQLTPTGPDTRVQNP